MPSILSAGPGPGLAALLLSLALAACSAAPAPVTLAGSTPEKGIGGTGHRPGPDAQRALPPNAPALARDPRAVPLPPPAPPPVSTAIEHGLQTPSAPPPPPPPPVPAVPGGPGGTPP